MDKYLYQGQQIEYAGFKMEHLYCFYLDDKMIYLSQTVINTLTKI